jgi:drug/metabolite transporter (DMT)-like permease
MQRFLPHIYLIIVNLIYGANFSIAKTIMPKFILPNAFIVLRVSFAAILYWIIFKLFLKETIQKTDLKRFFACGFFGIAANQILFFKGISLTSSVHGALIMITTPIITLILSKFILKETLSFRKLAGIALGMIGAGLLIWSNQNGTSQGNLKGDLFVLLNAICYAIFLIIVKPLMQKYHPLTVIFICFLMGSPWVFLFGVEDALSIEWSLIPTIYYLNIFFILFGATFLVYLLNALAIKKVSPTVVSSYIYLQPLFAIVIVLLYQLEKITFDIYIYGFLIALGLFLINFKFNRKKG